MNSAIPKFYKKSIEERRDIIKKISGLTDEDIKLLDLQKFSHLENMIENVIGVMELPIGIATNFCVNGKDYIVPMVTEEPSVVAAASHGAKIARVKGGFTAKASEPVMIGQIQVTSVKDLKKAKEEVLKNKSRIMEVANECDPMLIKFGGGCKDVEARIIGDMLVIHVLVNCRDAMGANAVNTMAERASGMIEDLTGGRVLLRILSNLAIYRTVRSEAVFDKDAVGGEETVDNIIKAYELAEKDVFRCATHNKGIMNGIDAVCLATGNDFRAVEAGAHSYAAIDGRYKPLTRYRKDDKGNLAGSIELPLAVGTIGGATRSHPQARINLKILGAGSATELAEVITSLGLAQNFAALKALATEGIQKGHMRLHARNLAISAGVPVEHVDAVVRKMIEEKKITMDAAKNIFEEFYSKRR